MTTSIVSVAALGEMRSERGAERLRRLESHRRVFFDRHQDEIVQNRRHAGMIRWARPRLLQMRRHDRIIAVAQERPPAGHHLVHGDAQRIQIRPRIGGAPVDLLRDM